MKNRNRVFAAGALLVFLLSTLFFWKINPASALTEAWIDEAELGQMCIRQVIPSAGKLETAENTETNDGQDNKLDAYKADSDAAKEEKSDQEEEKTEDIKVSGDPQVIIYHTHSTESYMPYKESNYHREAEEGTVRDVGNVLETELKKRGINVIHDKTVLHGIIRAFQGDYQGSDAEVSYCKVCYRSSSGCSGSVQYGREKNEDRKY